MPMLDTLNSGFDYFTILPGRLANETPLCSPLAIPDGLTTPPAEHPLLAFRPPTHPPLLSPNMASNFMSVQTTAAHAQLPARPRPVPMQQDVLWTSSNDSSSSSDSSSESTSQIPVTARCSRCQRTPSVDIHTGKSNMISYGLNLWYCNRCAALVGFKR